MFKNLKKPKSNLKVMLNGLANKNINMNFFLTKNKNEINSTNNNEKCLTYNFKEKYVDLNILKK
jgi:hypothetical protein